MHLLSNNIKIILNWDSHQFKTFILHEKPHFFVDLLNLKEIYVCKMVLFVCDYHRRELMLLVKVNFSSVTRVLIHVYVRLEIHMIYAGMCWVEYICIYNHQTNHHVCMFRYGDENLERWYAPDIRLSLLAIYFIYSQYIGNVFGTFKICKTGEPLYSH